MTPTELLANVLLQFEVVYLTEPQQLAILERALMGFQDRAGLVRTVKTASEDDAETDDIDETAEVAVPEHFLSAIGASDERGAFYSVTVEPGEDEEDAGKLIIDDAGECPPHEIFYFVKLTDWPSDEDLPGEVLSLLMDYLSILIEIPNTRRARAVAATAGLQNDFMSEQELLGRKTEIELQMEENKAMLPMFTASA